MDAMMFLIRILPVYSLASKQITQLPFICLPAAHAAILGILCGKWNFLYNRKG